MTCVAVSVVTTILGLVSCCWAQKGPCSLGGEYYHVGQTWHPRMLPYKENPCATCTCHTGGEIRCTGVKCPKPDCEEPRFLLGICCPTCDVVEEDTGSDVIDMPGCDFHGESYEDGDIFPSNKTAYKPNHDNQCVLCACYRGEVICHLKTCLPNPKCRKLVPVHDDCCLQCEDQSQLEDYFVSILSENGSRSLEQGDCLSATGRRKNGTSWNPVVGHYGEMECILCTCLDSRVECSRLKCPDESTLPCPYPRHRDGACCKECPEDRQSDRKRKKKKGKGKGKGKGRKKKCQKGAEGKSKKKCKKRDKKSRNKRTKAKKGAPASTTPPTAMFSPSMRMSAVLHKLCIPTGVDRVLYHTKGSNFESLAFDGPRDKSIEHIRWTIKKGRIQSAERTMVLELEDFRNNMTVANLAGGVHKKDIKRFLRRLAKREKRCKKKCRRKLLDRSIQKIKVTPIDLTKSCSV